MLEGIDGCYQKVSTCQTVLLGPYSHHTKNIQNWLKY